MDSSAIRHRIKGMKVITRRVTASDKIKYLLLPALILLAFSLGGVCVLLILLSTKPFRRKGDVCPQCACPVESIPTQL